MLVRVMGSPNPERPAGGGPDPPKVARSTASCSSLNSFVVSHQTPNSHSKGQKGPGLPKARQRGSTGNLVAAGLGANGVGGHRHRYSCDTEGGSLSHMTRAASLSQDLPAQEWLDGWKPPTAMSPIRAPSPVARPLCTQSGPPSLDASILAPSSRSSTDTAEGTGRQEQGNGGFPGGFGMPSARQPERPVRRFVEDTTMAEEETSPANSSLGVPVFVMMPLDTVNSDGVFRHASSRWFQQALETLAASGVHGIAIDVWWGAVERSPETYDWEGYRQVFELAKSFNLKIQVVLSFHACGGNVGDSAQIPLPKWVLEAGDKDPDLFFLDRPRESRDSLRNTEYISFWADEAPGVVCGRSPLECYTHFMRSFRDTFAEDIGSAIEDVVIGCGPCGELRYASYPEINNWRFPGVGEFQCYDRRALMSLAQTAREAGHPEWGRDGGPHDAGEYNSNPEETGFFCCWGGSWDTPYGRFFLEWYAKSLVDHGERLLRAASRIFNFRLPASRLRQTPQGGPGDARLRTQSVDQGSPSSGGNATLMSECDSPGTQGTDREGQAGELGSFRDDDSSQMTAGDRSLNASTSSFQGMSNAASRSSLLESGNALGPDAPGGNANPLISQNSDSSHSLSGLPPRLRRAGRGYDGKSLSLASLATSDRPPLGMPGSRSEDARAARTSDSPACGAVGVTLKVAGVHWWYRTRAHAAELTAGYFNSGDREGYRDIIALCAKYNASFTLTCVEMCDSQHPPEALCGPEGLLRQVKEAAAEAGVEIGGENALPCFSHMHIDEAGLNRIVYNSQAWGPPLQEEAAKEEALYNRHPGPNAESPPAAPAIPPLPDAVNLGFNSDPRFARSGKLLQGHLPKMRGLTFLRLAPEMMSPSYQVAWVRFMHRMQNLGPKPK